WAGVRRRGGGADESTIARGGGEIRSCWWWCGRGQPVRAGYRRRTSSVCAWPRTVRGRDRGPGLGGVRAGESGRTRRGGRGHGGTGGRGCARRRANSRSVPRRQRRGRGWGRER